jgi:redox-sensitive bicupin YhaK (pirin superfamily)
MINLIHSKDLYVVDGGWRTSRYHFSFADYQDPANNRYGVLRAFNDELIQPNSGFECHPHDEMEIISYCVQGELSHSDNMGNQRMIHRGDVQYICAGSGIIHAEMNESLSESLRFIQVWILPNQPGLSPHYSHMRFPEKSRQNRLLRVASGERLNGTFHIKQDANIYISEIQRGNQIPFEQSENRQDYLACIEGTMDVNGTMLSKYEAARISRETKLLFTALEDTHLILVEMAET